MPALLRSLDDPPARRWAADAIGYYGSAAKEAVPALSKLLTDSDVAMCRSAADALGRIGPDASASVDALLTALNSQLEIPDYGNPKPNIAHALGEIGGKPEVVIPALVKCFGTDKKSDETSSACAQSVAKYGRASIPIILPLLNSPEPRKRFWAAVAFFHMKVPAKEALPALEKLLNDPDPEVRGMAGLAVERIREGKAQPLTIPR
jgi:HEAT repeat protein